MGKVKGLTRRQLLQRHYNEALHDVNVYMEAHRQNVDKLIKNFNESASSNLWGLSSIPATAVRGLLGAAVEATSFFSSVSAQFSNEVSYLLDPDRRDEWQDNLKYMVVNLGANMLEGVSAFAFGAAADLGHLTLGKDTSWADDPIEGVIANFNRLGNQLRANALDPNKSAFEGVSAINRGFWTGINEKFLGEDPDGIYSELEFRDETNRLKFENRWQTEKPRPIGEGAPPVDFSSFLDEEVYEGKFAKKNKMPYRSIYSNDYKEHFKQKYNTTLPPLEKIEEQPHQWTPEELEKDRRRYVQEQYRHEIFEDMVQVFERNEVWKENIDKWTGKEFFDRKAGDSIVYKYAEPVFYSLGRLIPSFIMTKYSGGTGLGSEAMRIGSRAWFAGTVAGGAMEEAVLNGASMEDALSFALGSAANELFWAQAGGIRLGDAASLAIMSQRKVFRTALIEAAEEMMIEQGYRGLGYYSNPDNEIETGESRRELWDRVFYSGMVGGLSGFFMGELSFLKSRLNRGQVVELNKALQSSIKQSGVEATRTEINRIAKRLHKRLNSDSFINQKAKDTIMSDPIASQLFNEVQQEVQTGEVDAQGNPITETRTRYEFSDTAQKIQRGEILAKQGDTTITTETHAVSNENYFAELKQTVDVVNSETNRLVSKPIEVVTKERLSQTKNSQMAQEILDSGMNVAFVEVKGRNVQATPDSFDSFFDPSTGITYVNVHSEVGFENLLAHEVNDALGEMARKGNMTKKGREAYSNFIETYASEVSTEMFQDLGVTFNETAYAQAYKGRENFSSLMETERVSAFLQQAMNNEAIIERGLKKDRGIFEGIASIFTRKSYYNKMLQEMGVNPSQAPQLAKSLSKLERSFTNAIRANKQQLQRADNLANNLFGKKGVESMFSMQNHKENINEVKQELMQNFFDTQSGANGLQGLNVENFLKTENLTSFLDFHIQNPNTTYEILNEQSGTRFEDGYFLKINDTHYFHKDMLNVNQDMFVKDISFDQNSHHFTLEIASKKNPEVVSIVRKTVPSIEHNNRIIKNSSLFEASLGLEQLEVMNNIVNKKGNKNILLSPAQSFAVSSTSGNEMFTNRFGPVTLMLKKEVSQERDFNVWKKDIGSIGRKIEIGDHYFDMFFGERTIHSDVRSTNKVEILKNVLNFNKNIAAPRIMAEAFNIVAPDSPTSRQMENITNDIFDAIKTGQTQDVAYETMFQALDTLKIDHNNRMTLDELKAEINIAQDSIALDIFELQNEAINSFEYLVKEGIELKTLYGYLNYYDLVSKNKKATNPYYALSKIFGEAQVEIAQTNKKHFDKINEYLETISYHLGQTGMTSEGKMNIEARHVEAVVFDQNHTDIKGNKKAISDIKNMLESIQQQMAEQGNTPFEVYDYREYNGKQDMIKQNFLNKEKGSNVFFSMNNKKSQTLNNKSVENVRQDVNQQNKSISQTNEQNIQDVVSQQDFNDYNERVETQQTITQNTQNKFAQNVIQKGGKTVKTSTNRFQQAQNIAKTVSKQNYESFEINFADKIDSDIQNKIKRPKTKLEKTAKAIYTSLEGVIKKQKTNREFYNHMGSHVAKTIVNELTTLSDLIKNDPQRTNYVPTDVELEYIARQVNKAIFQTLDYIDSEVKIEINKTPNNPEGYAFTRGVYWYLRDMKNVNNWDFQTIQNFQDNHLGFSYRRLINSILNFNKKNGNRELHNAMAHFSRATRVENVSDLALDGDSPRTIDNAKKQWEDNTKSINLINESIGFEQGFGGWFKKAGLDSWLDAFTVGETSAHWNNNGWAVVLNNKLVDATNKKLEIERKFKEHFEANNFIKNNYKNIVQLDNPKNAIKVKNLGNINVNQSQVIYLRDMMLREIVRNRAIDLGLLRGEKSNHFNAGNKVDILGKSFLKDARVDSKTVGTISDPIALLNELDSAINRNPFMQEYNSKVMEFFNNMYPYVNERFKEIHGINLQNDGQVISERLQNADSAIYKNLFNGLPSSINLETISSIYVPFLLDNSGYFKQNKIDFTKGIIDMGVFDGMTQEISDSNAIISVESITDVVSSYSREVANYYALHRVMNDFNRVLNERLESYEQTTYVGRNIPNQAITFYENLLNDMAGYRPRPTNPKMNNILSHFRKNFYRASLGANLRVIGSQVTTMFNLSNMYGSHFTEMFPKMMTNFFAQHTKNNKKKVQYLEDNNNVYWDRKRSASFEVGEATTEGLFANNAFNRTMQNLMKGIKFTDGSINRSLYLTLLDTINPETGNKFTQAEASNEVQKAILRSQSSVLALAKSPLLRTHNELFRVMLRFLGEPMKLITQSYNSAKQLQYLNKLKSNRSKVIDALNKEVSQAQNKLDSVQQEIATLEARENSDAFNNLSEAEQKRIHNRLKELRRQSTLEQENVNRVEQNKDNTINTIDKSLAEAPRAKTLAKKRYSAFIVATLYLTFLRAGFDLVRSKGGAKDRPDEQEFMEYLAKTVGTNFMDSLTGSFPFIREAYQTISSGYSSTGIAEFAAVDDLFRTSGQLIKNIAGDGDVHVGRTVRNISMAAGRLMGVPSYQIERLFTTPTLYVNESLHYRYQSAIGRRTRDNIELKRAIERGDTQMIQAVVDRRIISRGITVSNPVSQELVRLYGEGQEVNMSGINRSFTIDGETYEMTRAERNRFGDIYNKADHIIHKIMKSPQYRRLNNDMKRSIIQSVYTYYYNMAKQKISGVEIIPEQNYFTNLNQAYRYFLDRIQSLINRQSSTKYLREQREKALAN